MFQLSHTCSNEIENRGLGSKAFAVFKCDSTNAHMFSFFLVYLTKFYLTDTCLRYGLTPF